MSDNTHELLPEVASAKEAIALRSNAEHLLEQADLHFRGINTPKDKGEALRLLSMAAEQENQFPWNYIAASALARLIRNTEPACAISLHERLANNGFPAESVLAAKIYGDKYVESKHSMEFNDFKKCIKWAYESKDVDAIKEIIRYYLELEHALKSSTIKARKSARIRLQDELETAIDLAFEALEGTEHDIGNLVAFREAWSPESTLALG